MKQQVGSRVEHWSAYRARHGRLFVGAPRTVDPLRRWFERLRNRHGGAAYGPPRGTQAENYGLIHRAQTMYRVRWPTYVHSSITACADAICGRTLPRHAFLEHPAPPFRARPPGQQPAHARAGAEARRRRGAAESGACRLSRTRSGRASRSSLPRASLAGRPARVAAHQRPGQALVPARHRRGDRVGRGERRHALILLPGFRRAGGRAARASSWPSR